MCGYHCIAIVVRHISSYRCKVLGVNLGFYSMSMFGFNHIHCYQSGDVSACNDRSLFWGLYHGNYMIKGYSHMQSY